MQDVSGVLSKSHIPIPSEQIDDCFYQETTGFSRGGRFKVKRRRALPGVPRR
jgi:hypothetical protein